MAGTSPAMTKQSRNDARENFRTPRKFFFIIFVDRIFTTLFERLFTKVFDVIR
jgi:hypothetical protein